MKKKIIFKGVATALITPFKNEKIDYHGLERLIEEQIASGIDALVIGGTTGEAAVLDRSEREELYHFSSKIICGRIPMIAGVGTNDTKTTLEYAAYAEKSGADALLAVTPYYNKGTADGIVSHYLTLANSTDLPIILYNVPSRTGVNLSLDAIKKLATHKNVVAIKEASDSIDRLTSLSVLSDEITLYSGNDSQIYSTLSLGGLGIISVASNAIPKLIKDICNEYFMGNYKRALVLQHNILEFVNSLFFETNPAPIKYLMHKLGFCTSEIRLPLTIPNKKTQEKLLLEYEKITKMA